MDSFSAPVYTQMPDALLDDVLPAIDSLSELKVTLVVVRATLGWHRRRVRLSLTDLEQKTGLARSNVRAGVESALQRGTIIRRARGDSYLYELNIAASSESGIASSESGIATGSESGIAVVANQAQPRAGVVASSTLPENDNVNGKEKTAKRETSTTPPFPQEQTSLLPSPLMQVWEHWLTRSGRRQKLTPDFRRLIDTALQVATVDECCQAIDGLHTDPWWRENRSPLELRYALHGNRAKAESDQDRIEKMAAKAKGQGGPNGLISVAQLIERFPAEHRSRAQSEILDVIEAMPTTTTPNGLSPPDRDRYDKGLARLQQMRDYGFEIVIDDNGHVAGARTR